MQKPINLSLRFRVPKDKEPVKATISPDGGFSLRDADGNEVIPESIERTVSYEREGKNPKIQSHASVSNESLSVNGLEELQKYDSVIAIDTNTKSIEGKRLSVCAFVNCKFIPDPDGVRIEHDGKLNIFEFWNVPAEENAEKLALLKVVNDIQRSSEGSIPKICLITDCDVEAHDSINRNTRPLYRKWMLPTNFHLQYASTDTGSEAFHKLIRFCDTQANAYFRYLAKGEIKASELEALPEEPSVQYRYMFRSDVEIINPVVSGISLKPGTKVNLYGIEE